ncbi:alpha-sarcoglycan isoform X2 [Rhinatrema bivittatum]|uniref:alpha-sarcoglycan isoform X2 n=1 Tax=Rhinatrema bivittatum TaxID=194408 RepID=UPI001126DF19|nr:alpha-sarcoglycan isoform X2 [Rhinatrema bivittatum]
MAAEEVRSAFLAVLLGGLLPAACADHIVYPSVGSLFVHELDPVYFQKALASSTESYRISSPAPFTFHANLEGHPDLPRWLRYTQRTPSQSGYLYGSPTPSEAGRQIIQVTAYDRQTYDTLREKIMFYIGSTADSHLPYQAEFFVQNWDVEELLPEAAQQDFQRALDSIWNLAQLNIVNITSALDRGGRVPLPIEGRKEGVYVKVSSDAPFPACLREARSPANQFLCSLQQQPFVSCYDSFFPKYKVNWCNITLMDGSGTEAPVEDLVVGDGVMEAGSEFNPPDDSLERVFLPDYLLTILLPLLVALLLTLLLSYIMCCRREGLDKRDEQTSDIQMVHHHSIQANTDELREMARGRDVPRPLSTLPMFNVRTGERSSPLQQGYDTSRVPLILAQK